MLALIRMHGGGVTGERVVEEGVIEEAIGLVVEESGPQEGVFDGIHFYN